jgi:hypothetical protein
MVRRSLTLASAALVIFSAGVFAQTTPQQRKLTDAEKKEIQTVQKVVDDAAAGQATANDVGLAWIHEDLLKAQGNKQYLPFSVTIDPTKVPGNKVTFYWRVVSKDAAAPAAAESKDAKDDKGGRLGRLRRSELDPTQSGQTGPVRIADRLPWRGQLRRVRGGERDGSRRAGEKGLSASSVSSNETITVPNLGNDRLPTSSVIVAERIDCATLTRNGRRRTSLGTMEIVPATSTKFTRKRSSRRSC